MLHKTVRRFQNGQSYYVFLIGRDVSMVTDPEDVLYTVIIRNILNINDIFDLQIRLKLARNLFKQPDVSQEEIDRTLIIYKKNKRAFQVMIDCLEIKGEEDFTLDFKRFKAQLNNLGNITISDNNDITTSFIE
jgi:hypothetical protein